MYSFKISVNDQKHSFSIVSTENDEHVTEGVTVGNNHQIGLSSSFFEHSASEQFNHLLTAIADRIPELQFEGCPTASRYLGEPIPTKIQSTFEIPSPPDCYPKVSISSLPYRSSFLRHLGDIINRIECDKLELTNIDDLVNSELKDHILSEYKDIILKMHGGSISHFEIWVLWCYRKNFKYPFVITDGTFSGHKSTTLNWTNTDNVLRETTIYEYTEMYDESGIIMSINALMCAHSAIMWAMPEHVSPRCTSAFYRRVCIIAKSLAVSPDLVNVTNIDDLHNREIKRRLHNRLDFKLIEGLEIHAIRVDGLSIDRVFIIINGEVSPRKIIEETIALTYGTAALHIYQYEGMVDELAIITDINKVLNS